MARKTSPQACPVMDFRAGIMADPVAMASRSSGICALFICTSAANCNAAEGFDHLNSRLAQGGTAWAHALTGGGDELPRRTQLSVCAHFRAAQARQGLQGHHVRTSGGSKQLQIADHDLAVADAHDPRKLEPTQFGVHS